jgi:formylglycine-generating enzyme required for sulfatase activity
MIDLFASLTRGSALLLISAGCIWGGQASFGSPLEMVIINKPRNADDQFHAGGVAYNFRIGKYEVTNAQYTDFLNVKALVDPLQLYSTEMQSSDNGGIARTGVSGSYHYTVKAGMGDKPATFVNWYDAARFANWMHNGRGNGDTESGAYTLLGGTPIPSSAASIRRNSGARWFIPNFDEWHKAAYFDPATSSYSLYPMRSDTPPTAELAPGGTNSGNFDGILSTALSVGSYVNSPSFFGTFDQGGNVWEWNENTYFSDSRGHSGGSWSHYDQASSLSAQGSWALAAELGRDLTGFRMGAIIPEPATLAMLFVGSLGLLCRR